ncbi:hypothetical protein EAH79_13745 [Sphingomonas koreensis]|nr:hypothetical protein EAH79_13745 [Sphingomonas koreensis]
MLALLLVAASATFTAPPEPQKGQLQSAIWADLQLNATIGNGNWIASLWYQAGSDTAPNLHIEDLACTKTRSGQRCSFSLHRDGGSVMVLGENAPDKLSCLASFSFNSDGWSVVHTPSHGAGHSVTSMKCKTMSL